MKHLVLLVASLAVPGAIAGVAQERYIAATKGTRRIVVRHIEPPEKSRSVLLDTSDENVVARIRSSIVLEDPKPQFDEHGEEIWTLPSFCCAQYSIAFVRPDGSQVLYLVKHEITAILPPDRHGLHDLTDIPLSKKSQSELRGLLVALVKKPNQPPEPTVMSVTPRACARVAPATTVAHL